MKLIKSIIKIILSLKFIGIPLSNIFGLFGQYQYAYKIISICHKLPDYIKLRLPASLFSREILKLQTLNGTDQVVRKVAIKGWQSFEPPFPYIFSISIHPNMLVYDVGANTGYYALLAASISPDVKVHAFEPFPLVEKILRDNINTNMLSNQIEAFSFAASNTIGTAKLYIPDATHGLVETSASLGEDFRDTHSDVLNIKVKTLDSHMAETNGQYPDIIKIDVETQEPKVLEGLKIILQEGRPIVFLEVLKEADIETLDNIKNTVDYISIQMHSNTLTVQSSIRFDPDSDNQMLVPREKLSTFKELAQNHKLSFLNVS